MCSGLDASNASDVSVHGLSSISAEDQIQPILTRQVDSINRHAPSSASQNLRACKGLLDNCTAPNAMQ
jgi:hypothetical protein